MESGIYAIELNLLISFQWLKCIVKCLLSGLTATLQSSKYNYQCYKVGKPKEGF